MQYGTYNKKYKNLKGQIIEAKKIIKIKLL